MSAHPNLNSALAAAQAELANPACDRQNSHFGQPYATLQSVMATIRPVFGRHGLALSMVPMFVRPKDEGSAIVELDVRILHASGESIAWVVRWPTEMNIQKAGGIVTYLRRYVACGIAGVAGEVDDDAEDVVAPTRKAAPNGR